MKFRWAALMIVLALGAMMPSTVGAQSSPTPQPRGESAGKLGQNYPNPFNPETTIPFTIGDPPMCEDPGKTYRVTLRIYNVLAQLVAIPLLIGGGDKLENVSLTCGTYTAFWNGRYLDSDREVASGIYLYRLEVDGKAVVKKMIVMK